MLEENKYNYIMIIKNWLKPSLDVSAAEVQPSKSLNQRVIGEIRNFMDEGYKLIKYRKQLNIIINLTNDYWFGSFSGPYQHFYLSRIRSAELNKYIIRVSNNGVSGIFDNKGKILESIELNKNGQKNVILNIPTDLNNLFNYHFIIYIFLVIIIGIAILIDLKKNE